MDSGQGVTQFVSVKAFVVRGMAAFIQEAVFQRDWTRALE